MNFLNDLFYGEFNAFHVLALIGGLCLFLFGMNVMGEGLERRAGNSLKALLAKLTNNKFMGFLTGLGVTAVIQSSSATTVMVVGFVNSNVMTLKQAAGVILGANLGTAITGWILSLGGISGGSIVLDLLKPTSFTPILALIGIGLTMFSKSSKNKDTGSILLGFATLMFGMDAMSSAVSGLAEIDSFKNLFLMFSNPLLGLLVGAVVTGIIQSSSASVGILQALAHTTGAVTYGSAIPIIMGQNIGTCVTALLSSFGTNKNAKRAAMVHLSFNIIGALLWLTVFWIVKSFVEIPILGESAGMLGIAIVNTTFKLLNLAIFLPASSVLEKIAYLIVPEGEDEKAKEKTVSLDERLLATPAIALAQCANLTGKMATETAEGLRLSITSIGGYSKELAEKIHEIEGNADHYEDILGTYLAKLSQHQVSDEDSATISKLLKAIGDFERISDHSVNILESVEELKAKGIELSESAKGELNVMCRAVDEILTIAHDSFVSDDFLLAYDVEPLEQVIDDLKDALRDSHIVRLKGGECTVEAGFIWADLLTNLERVADHCSNIALGVIDAKENNMDAHAAQESMTNSVAYDEKYVAYTAKYAIHSIKEA